MMKNTCSPINRTRGYILIIKRTTLTTFALFVLANTSFAKTQISFPNDTFATSCAEYVLLRKNTEVLEHVNNKIIESEYLDCSLSKNLKLVSNSSLILKTMLNQVGTRSIPSSLGPSVSRTETFEDTGFRLNEDVTAIKLERPNRNFVISLKGELSKNTYLIWVVDEILDANYRSYYAAIFEVTGQSGKIKPYYASGF